MYTFLLTLQIDSNIKIKINRTKDTTKTYPCFLFLKKQCILNTG